MENLSPIRILSISDIHMGNTKVPASILYERLTKYVYPLLTNIHILFICGDFFDNLADLNSSTAYYTNRIILDLQHYSKTYGLKIRILRGTYLHDREQCSLFLTIKDPSLANAHNSLDIKYFNTIDIEYIEKLGLYVLYIPDNLPYKNSYDVISTIRAKMKECSINSIDITVVHGYFEHMLPKEIIGTQKCPHCVYSHEQFSSFVCGVILVGHVHTSSIYKNIICNGSFDRLAHGEEERKGFFLLEKNNTNNWNYTFIENKDATLFITLPITTDNAKEAIDILEKTIQEKIPNHQGYIRIISDNQTIKQTLHMFCVKNYPDIIFKDKTPRKTITKTIHAPITFEENTLIPTKENIGELVYNFLKDKNLILNDDLKDRIVQITMEI